MKGIHNNLKQLKMDTVSPATRLLDKRRLMYQVQEAFERQKDEEARRLEMFNNKEEELRARDLAVQEKFVEFSKVINENEAKLQRARNRIEEENKAIEAKQKRKKELQDRVTELKNKANHLEATVQAMKVYEEYLETVKNKYPEEYTDISDILSLELKLSNANKQLKAKQKTLEDMNGDLRKAKDHLETRKKNEIMLLNIDIAQRSKQCEDIEAKRIDLTKLLEQMSAKSVYKQVEIGHIFMAIDNLYSRCKESKDGLKIHHPSDQKFLNDDKDENIAKKFDQVIEKLKIIKAYLTDFRKVFEDLPQVVQKSVFAKDIAKVLSKEGNNN